MSFNLKNYLKLSAVYTIAAAFPVIIQIFVLPLIEGGNRLGATDFSHIAIAEAISSFIGIVILFSMSGAVSRFYYDYLDDPLQLNRLFSSILTGILFRFLVVLGTGILLGDWFAGFFSQPQLHDFSSYGYAAIVIGLNRAVVITVITLYRNERKVMAFVWVNLLVAALRTAGQLGGVFFYRMDFTGYVNGTALGGGIMTLFLLIYIFRRTGIHFSRTLVKPVYSFALPLFIFELVRWGVMFTDRLFLEKFPVDLGIYDTAQRFAFGLYYIFQGLYGAAQPDFFLYLTNGISQTANDIRRLSNVYMMQAQLAVILLVLPVILYISLFFETALSSSVGFITIIFCQYILIGMNTLMSLPLIYYKKTRPYLYMNLITLAISLLLNFSLIPVLKIYGAIISFYAANIIQFVLFFKYQKRIIDLPWNKQKIIGLPLSIIALAVLAELVKHAFSLNPVVVAIGFVFIAAAVISITYWQMISGNLKKIDIQSIKKVIFGTTKKRSEIK